MKTQPHPDPVIPQLAALNAPVRGEGQGIGRSDHFLRLMFFQASDFSEAYAGPRMPGHVARDKAPPKWTAIRSAHYVLPDRSTPLPVRADSPALEVMTDLRHVTPITTTLLTTIDEANRTMITHGVRALFVVDHQNRLLGMITASDILGERPVTIAQQRGIRHDEIVVRDIMTPADYLEVISIDDVLRVQVSDVVALLKYSGRRHALVVDPPGRQANDVQMVRGLFSLAQIARQLGVTLQSTETARSFAEIEAAIGV